MLEQTFKVVILGDSCVGKSSIVTRYITDKFYKFQEPTIGASFITSIINKNNKEINLNIWDTAGQERYKSLAPLYYKGASACLIVFDITNNESFNSAKNWVKILRNINDNYLLFLIGNKLDLNNNRNIEFELANNYSKNNDIKYLEISAKEGININELFDDIANTLDKYPELEKKIDVKLDKIKKIKKCC